MTTIALVSCVKMKARRTCRARDLYISPLFQSMRKYAEENADEWYILSAMYGLLNPLELVRPYELTLKTMKKPERVAWAKKVRKQLKIALPSKGTIMFLAGKDYREYLQDHLEAKGYKIRIPMEGLKLGDQLKWLKEQTTHKIQREGFGLT